MLGPVGCRPGAWAWQAGEEGCGCPGPGWAEGLRQRQAPPPSECVSPTRYLWRCRGTHNVTYKPTGGSSGVAFLRDVHLNGGSPRGSTPSPVLASPGWLAPFLLCAGGVPGLCRSPAPQGLGPGGALAPDSLPCAPAGHPSGGTPPVKGRQGLRVVTLTGQSC